MIFKVSFEDGLSITPFISQTDESFTITHVTYNKGGRHTWLYDIEVADALGTVAFPAFDEIFERCFPGSRKCGACSLSSPQRSSASRG